MIARHNPSLLNTTRPMTEQGLLSCSYAMLTFAVSASSGIAIGGNIIPSLSSSLPDYQNPLNGRTYLGTGLMPILFTTFGGQSNPCLAPFSVAEQYMDSRTWHQLLRRVSLFFVIVSQSLILVKPSDPDIYIPRKIPHAHCSPPRIRHQSLILDPSLSRLSPLWIDAHPFAFGWPRFTFLPPPSRCHHLRRLGLFLR